MKQHLFRITVEPLGGAQGEPCAEQITQAPLQFEVGNHDDILAVVERLRGRGDFSANDAAAFGVGLKLFGEVMLHNKSNPLFASLMPHFGQFMKDLKKGSDKA